MTKKIYGGLDVTHNVTTKGKRIVQGINNETFDENGNLNINTYTRQEMLDIVALMPLSHYGTHNYLPAGVSGSFDGASENQAYRRGKVFLEDDGTLVFLRAGTNGSTQGVYYAYMQNALFAEDMSLSVNTNKEYQPGYFGSNRYAIGMISTDDNIVVGYYAERNSTSTGIFVSIMNETLDDTQHTGFFVSSIDVSPVGTLTYAMRANDGSYYFFSTDTSYNKFEVCVVRLVYNQSTGTYTSNRITGWNNKIFYNSTENGTDNIVLIRNMISHNVADKPYALCPPTANDRSLFMTSIDLFVAQDPSSGQFRIRVNGDSWFASSSQNTRPQHGFSYTINMSTKSSVLDPGNDKTTLQAPMVIDSNFSYFGTVINNEPLYNHAGYRNIFSCYLYLETGDVFSISTPNLAQALLLQRSKFNAGSVFQMIKVRDNISNDFSAGIVKPTFGSSIGSWITGLELLPNNSTKQFTNTSSGTRPSYSVHKSSPTFTFKSVDRGTIKGFEPTTDRNFISSNWDNRAYISTVSGNNVTTNGGIFICDNRYEQSFSYDYHSVGTGKISITPSVLDNFRNTEYSKIPASWNLSPSAAKSLTLFVPQQSDIPAFVMLSTITNNLANYVKMMEVNVNTRSGNISSISFKRTLFEEVNGNNFTVNSSAGIGDATIGLNIYDAGSFYVVGGSNPLFHNTIGNTNTPYFRGLIHKGSNQFADMRTSGYHPSYDTNSQPGSLPGHGFGIFNKLDQSNKIIFQSCGTTVDDYNAWTPKGDPIVIVSQDVAQGFIVYFTEETPVLLSGKSFTLPISNINLTSIKANPANTTFYLYVKMNQGIAEYHITENVISETGTTAYNVFWIGTIRTDSIQIESINVFKRSRLDVFGASLEPAGSAFPVSYGLPSNKGNINW